MAKKNNGLKTVVTRTDHYCWIPKCGKLIPAGSTCLSRSFKDKTTGTWKTIHGCPGFSCFFPPEERAKLLASPQPTQEDLLN